LDFPVSLLGDLDAFYLDHRRCGDLRAGVQEREETVVWLECEGSARIVWAIDAAQDRRGSAAVVVDREGRGEEVPL
jgi:hypothetical protein